MEYPEIITTLKTRIESSETHVMLFVNKELANTLVECKLITLEQVQKGIIANEAMTKQAFDEADVEMFGKVITLVVDEDLEGKYVFMN